jgi:hypothetical protein
VLHESKKEGVYKQSHTHRGRGGEREREMAYIDELTFFSDVYYLMALKHVLYFIRNLLLIFWEHCYGFFNAKMSPC